MSRKTRPETDQSHLAAEARRDIPSLAVKHQLIDADDLTDAVMASRIREVVGSLPDALATQIADTLKAEATPHTEQLAETVARLGISNAERLLLEALIAGDSVTQHAEKADISINTARTHMRRLLEKTGSSSQMDLVRKVLGGTA